MFFEVFSGIPGKYVPLEDTIRSFERLLAGEFDDLPEQAFMFVGTIEEAQEKKLKKWLVNSHDCF